MSRDAHPQRSSLSNALVPTVVILGALIIVAVFIIWLTNSSQADAAASKSGQLNADVMQRFESEYDELGVAIGSPDAPITIREFADYQCPACKAFESTSIRIRNELVSSGKVRFIFFDFPLLQHAHAFEAAVAARCAGRQDKYWAYQEALYANQNEWAPTEDPTSMFLDIAVETGLNTQRLKQCIVQGATRDAVQQSRDLGETIGIRATPTVMVGSKVFSGLVSYDRIMNIVQARTNGNTDTTE